MTEVHKAASSLAIVTGAASGMGEAAARLMRDAGWSLLLCDLNAERLSATAERLGGAETLAGDISAIEWPGKLAEAIGDRQVGAAIHCAGLSPTMADPGRILEVNLAAPMRFCDVLRDRMAENGSIVLFASSSAHMGVAALDPQIGAVTKPEDVHTLLAVSPESGAAYGVSKRGVMLLAQREAMAFGKNGTRVNSISPGIIDTPMGRQEMVTHPIMKALVESSALPRMAQAEEVAAVAVFLCSPQASFISATDILVDAGSIPGIRAMQARQQQA